MGEHRFDVVVIGSGPGGYVAALRAAELGLKTACVEKDGTCGGTCLNVGCIPSKALLQATEYFSLLKNDAREFGIEFEKVDFNFEIAQERKKNIVSGLVFGIESLFKKTGVSLIRGRAAFMSPNTIEVTDGGKASIIEGKNFILATGSQPIELPFLPFDEKIILSSTGALALKKPPKKLLMIGGGVIGVELASVYNRLGTEVTAIEMLDHICPAMDQAISKQLLQSLKKQGITFHLKSRVKSGKVENGQAVLDVEIQGKTENFSADAVLVAVGRKPYTQNLGLEKLGIATAPGGTIAVDSNFRTSQPNIYAIGDVIDGPMLAHKASQEGVVVAEIIAEKKAFIDYASLPNVIYTHPEAAAVGVTEEEAIKWGLTTVSGIAYFKANPRARCMGNTDGFVKIIAEKQSGKILGVHIIGPSASEIISEGVMAIKNRCTLKQIAETSHAHPTLCETILEACVNALQ